MCDPHPYRDMLMIGSLLRQTLNLLEVSFRSPMISGEDKLICRSHSRSCVRTPLTTFFADRSGRQPESSSEKEGVMSELPNSTIHPICPRGKQLMLLRLGKFSYLRLL